MAKEGIIEGKVLRGNDSLRANPKAKVTSLTVGKLQELIQETVKNTLEDFWEDWEALTSPAYIDSIKRARQDYREKRVKTVDEMKRDV